MGEEKDPKIAYKKKDLLEHKAHYNITLEEVHSNTDRYCKYKLFQAGFSLTWPLFYV